MLLIRQINKQSKRRFQIKHLFIHKRVILYSYITKWVTNMIKVGRGRIGIKHQKFKLKTEYKFINYSLQFKTIFYVTNYSNFSSKVREFNILKNKFNQIIFTPTTAVFYPGFKIYPITYLMAAEDIKKLIGQLIPLWCIPINMPLAFLFNKNNNKSTFIRSSGSVGFRRRFERKEKLITVMLPSKQLQLFPQTT